MSFPGSSSSFASNPLFIRTLTTVHLLAYGGLFGTEMYQSFVMTKVCFQALPYSAFTTLQRRVFPLYFKIQLALSAVVAASFPFGSQQLAGWDGVLLGMAGGMAALNWLVYGPQTNKIMVERIHQETRDGRKHSAEDRSDEMKTLNRAFSRAHAMSIHINLIAIIAAIGYGVRLASRITI